MSDEILEEFWRQVYLGNIFCSCGKDIEDRGHDQNCLLVTSMDIIKKRRNHV